MVLQLASEEAEGGPWRAELLTVVVEALLRLGGGRSGGSPGVVLAVDGRSSSGKTTLASRLQGAMTGSAVVHTDDIAWWHSRFGWADLLISGVLVPFHRGEPVSFRPPRWAEHSRQGSIEVPARCPVLIVEGVGAGRSGVSASVQPFFRSRPATSPDTYLRTRPSAPPERTGPQSARATGPAHQPPAPPPRTA